MTIDISLDDDSSEVVIIYDNASVIKITKIGDGANDFRYTNLDSIDDDTVANLIKNFAKSLLLI